MSPAAATLLAALASAGLPATPARSAEPASAQWQFSLRSAHHGDALPLRAFGNDDEALRQLEPRPGRNLIYVDDEVRSSQTAGAWTWSLLARNSATLVTGDETLDLARQLKRDVQPSMDRRWSATLRYEAFQGGGLEVGRAFVLSPRCRAMLSVQALRLRHWRERRLAGPVTFDAASAAYSFGLQSTDVNDRLNFPFQASFADGGAGVLLGGEMGWRDEVSSLALAVRDWGWLHWRGLPQQQASLSTQTQTYDADGFIVYKPLIEGRNSQGGYTRSLPGLWSLRGTWRVNGRSEIAVSSDWVRGFGALPAVAWRARVADVEWGLQWRFRERRATLSLSRCGWQLRLGADRLDSGMRSRELALSGNVAF